MSKNNISIYKPFDFKNRFIDFERSQEALKGNLDDFFIHALDDDRLKLRLPFPPHRKTVNDFILITNGWAKRHLGIESYEIHKNELIYVPKLQVSTTDFYSENLQGYYCHFSDDFLANNHLLLTWKSDYNQNAKKTLDQASVNRIIQLLDTINSLYQNNWRQNSILIAQYLRTVITEIKMHNSNNDFTLSKKKDLISEYLKLINIHLGKGLAIREYAKMLNISPNHLNKIIKTQLGKSAQSIYNEVILQEVKVLLLQTSKDISEITFNLGFEPPSYFGKFYKKHTGQTPLQYRKMIEMYYIKH